MILVFLIENVIENALVLKPQCNCSRQSSSFE